MTVLLISFFYTPHTGISSGFPLPIGHWWHHYYIIPLPTDGSTPLGWVIQSEAFPALTHPHICILTSWRGIPNFILHPTFREETSYAHSTLTQALHHNTLTHMFKVSACSLGMLHANFTHMSTYLACLLGARVHMTKVWLSFSPLKMVAWTFEDVLAAIQSPPSIPTSVLQNVQMAFTWGMFTLQRSTLPCGCTPCHSWLSKSG